MKTKKIQAFRDEVQALKDEIQAMKKSHADETNALIESYEMKIAANQRMHESEISAIKDEHEQEMRTANEKIAQLQNQLETQVEENKHDKLQDAINLNSRLVRQIKLEYAELSTFLGYGGNESYSSNFTDGVTNYSLGDVAERVQNELKNNEKVLEIFPNTGNLGLLYDNINCTITESPIKVLEYVNSRLFATLSKVVVAKRCTIESHVDQISLIDNFLRDYHINDSRREELTDLLYKDADDAAKSSCLFSFDAVKENLKNIHELASALKRLIHR